MKSDIFTKYDLLNIDYAVSEYMNELDEQLNNNSDEKTKTILTSRLCRFLNLRNKIRYVLGEDYGTK